MFELIDAFLMGFSHVFTWNTLLLMLVGIGVGFAVGILPGMGGPAALALMLPFIIKMEAVEAFAFLLGMASVTGTTGDITSILFGVPGEAHTAATILDGHPMAKNGEAGRALGAALASSLVGAIFGAFALALVIPIARPLVLSFGSPEFFMLTILGITFVASLSGGSLLKGLISGGIGLLFATVGLDPVSGVQRYTFGQLFLWDGIGLVPITIGLFALPEVLDLAVQGSSIAHGSPGKLSGVKEGVKDTFRHLLLVIRCSAIGTFIGIIPGMGAALTQWLAYAHAVQSSPNKERFGKGAVEGVLGPGAANNSALGGSLVTTIAFGVPSSIMMAILMGAFVIHGLVPGPDMLIPEKNGGHLSLTFSFVWTIILSNIITVLICLLFLKHLVKITEVRGNLIIPFILLLIYLGAFAEKNAIEDLLLVLFSGVLGWQMCRFNWPRPPFVLGLVLGPLAENRLFLSMGSYGFSWLTRPGVLILFMVTLAAVFYSAFKINWGKGQRNVQQPSPRMDSDRGRATRLTFSMQTLFSLGVLGILVLALWQGRNFNFRAGLFPWTIACVSLLLAMIQFVREVFGGEIGNDMEAHGKLGPEESYEVARRRIGVIFGWLIGFLVSIWLLGFNIAAPLCIFMYLRIGVRERWPISIFLSGATWVIIYGFFYRILHVPFPSGQLFAWL